jgi:1-(5-phosphoribosyl)-5-[(5-phosphoribosylamino)methylideneamino] imidazole-4-carboxamide isomerase/N-(5'phosphoribosyl)anthranilate isomerase
VILLPAIDLRDGRCVRLTQGDYSQETVYDDDPIAVALRFRDHGAQWLHVVDLDAALTAEPRNRDAIRAVIAAVPEIKVECSGGIRADDDVNAALDAGAARIVIGTRALKDPEWVARIAGAHGSRVAVGLDVRGTRLQARGWTEDAGELYPTLQRFDAAGVAAYVVTDVARDGMLAGPNLDLLRDVMSRTRATVVASGGVSSLGDLRALAALGVPECIVGKALYAGAFTLDDALEAANA